MSGEQEYFCPKCKYEWETLEGFDGCPRCKKFKTNKNSINYLENKSLNNLLQKLYKKKIYPEEFHKLKFKIEYDEWDDPYISLKYE